MTTFNPPTERTAAIGLPARHIADGHQTWWFHHLLAYATFLYRLAVWHAHYEWGQLLKRDRAAIIAGATLAVTAVAALIYT